MKSFLQCFFVRLLKCFCILPSAFCILLLSGCEWSAGTGGGSSSGLSTWNDRENFVDFSGVYKAADGGVVVRKAGAGSSSTTNTTYSTNNVSGEILGTGNGSVTAFSGVLAHPTLIRNSLTIVVGGYRFYDSSSSSAGTVALTVTPADGSAGTINYNTGAWTLSFPAPIANGTQILAAYSYLSTTTEVISNQGNHGDPIYNFVLYQQGNTVQLIDNCNSRYNGYIGNVRATGGTPIDPVNPTTPTAGPIIAQLYAEGVSQGYNVQIVGTLQGTLADGALSSRTLQATFVEEGGYDGNINAAAQ
jgi:hypothetical protein